MYRTREWIETINGVTVAESLPKGVGWSTGLRKVTKEKEVS